MKKFILLFVAIGAIAFYSCSKFEDLETVSLDGIDREFAVPIGTASFTMKELVEKFGERANIFIDPDNTIRLNYRADLPVKSGAEEIFKKIQESLTGQGGEAGFPVLENDIELPFNAPNGVAIDFMNLKKGELEYIINNNQDKSLKIKFEFPEVKKNGVSLTGEFDLPPGETANEKIDLSEYTLIPNSEGKITFNYTAITPAGDSITLELGRFLMIIRAIEFAYAEGYFAQQTHEGSPDSIVIDFFDEWTNGDVFFEEPKVSFYSKNSFGIPTQAVINYFEIETINLGRQSLKSPFIDDPESTPKFGFPGLDQVGETVIDTFTFDKDNSNIEDLLGAGPKKIYFDVDAVTNPDSNSSVRGFIDETSEYVFEVEADLPLYGKTNGFAVTQDLSWDFSENDNIQHAEFKIISENQLGLEIRLQGYFVTSDGGIIDSLFSEKTALIQPAPVDAQGYASGVTETTTFANFSAERFAKIKSAARLELKAEFYTPEEGTKSVRIESDQGMNLRMGLKFGL